MADSETTQAPQAPERRFRVKLVQREWRTTEQFVELNGEPLTGNKKEVLQKVQNFIDDEKDLEGAEYRLEIEEVEQGDPSPVLTHGQEDESSDS